MGRSPRSPQPRRGVSLFNRATVIIPVNGYSIVINTPFNGDYLATSAPSINITPTSTGGGTVDVQVEWRNGSPYFSGSTLLPSPLYTQSISDLPSGVPVNLPSPVP